MQLHPLARTLSRTLPGTIALSLALSWLLAGCDDPVGTDPPGTDPPGTGGPPVAQVTLEPDSLLLVVGNAVTAQAPVADPQANARARLLAVPRDAAGTPILGVPLRFSSSAPGVATVSDSGVVRGVSPGRAVVTVRAGSGTGQLHVTVERPYTLTFLGTLPGATGSRAEGINNHGQVVGISGDHAFLWENGGMTALTFPDAPKPLQRVSALAGINDRGEVGGLLAGQYVFLWRGGSSSYAPVNTSSVIYTLSDINERGEVLFGWVANYCSRNCGGRGLVFRNGQVDTLSNFGQLRLEPRAINDAGVVVGILYHRGSGTETGYAVRVENGELTYLSPGTPSGAGDVDAQGRVGGFNATPGKPKVAYVWAGSESRELGFLPRGDVSQVNRMNAHGVAIGESSTQWDIPKPRWNQAQVLFRDGKVIPLVDLYTAGDWLFEIATGINDRGQVVGYGKHRTTGATGALLLTPPQ